MNTGAGLFSRRLVRARRAISVLTIACLCASYLVAPVGALASKQTLAAAAAPSAAKNQRPVAVLATGMTGYAGIPMTVDGSGSYDPDGTIVSYQWDFNNDGVYDRTTTTPTTQYAFLATTQVVLRVTDNGGDTSTDRGRVTIIADASDPVAMLQLPDSALVGTPVTLDASGSYDTNGTIVSYAWDFESDGVTDATTTEPTTIHTWTAVGTYTAKVTVTDAVGKTGFATDTIEITSPIDLPPAVVAGLSAADVADDEGGAIRLTWTANTEADLSMYRVYRSMSPDSGFEFLRSADVATFDDYDLSDGVPYYYVVTAVDTAGNESAFCDAVSATAIDNLAPSAPSSLSVVDVPDDGGEALDVSWSAPSEDDVAGYRLTMSTEGSSDQVFELDALTTSYRVTGLSAGVVYRFTIVAYDEAGNTSASSGEGSGAPVDQLAPATPSGVTAEDRADDEGSAIVVAWSPNTEADLAGYRVYRQQMPHGAPEVVADTAEATFTDTNCIDGVDYGYSVVAYDTWGNASAPSAVMVARSFDWLPPLAVTSVLAMDVSADQGGAVAVWWLPSGSPDVIGHRVDCLDANGVVVASATETTSQYHVFTGLTNGAEYSFVVYAYDLVGNESAASPVAYATPADNLAPATPTDLSATDVAPDDGGVIALSWTPNAESDLAGYVVYVYDEGGTQLERSEVGFATSPLFTGLSAGAVYGFKVSALDVNGNESPVSARVDSGAADELAPAPVVASAADKPGDQGGLIVVQWPASASADVTGYRVYRDGAPIAEVSGLSYEDAVPDLVAHRYAVVAFDAAGNESAPSAEVFAAAVDNIAPAPPSNLAAEDVPGDDGGAIRVRFTPSTDEDVNGYCIKCYAADGSVVAEHHVAALDTECVFYDLANAVEYGFDVAAFDTSEQEGERTARITAMALDNNGPGTPTDVSAANVPDDEGGAVRITWTAVEGATGYKVFRDGVEKGDVTGTEFTDIGLENGTTYSYTVVAYDDSGNSSAPSEPVTATPGDETAPAAPIGFVAVDRPDDTGGVIELSWDVSVESDLAGYRLSRDGIQIAEVTTNSYTDTGLVNDRTYAYSIVAFDTNGNVGPAATASAMAEDNLVDTVPPTVPAPVFAKAVSYKSVVITWGESTDDNGVAGYTVQKRRAGGTWADLGQATTGWYVDSACAASTAYEYRVIARDVNGRASDPSAVVAVTTPATPTAFVTRIENTNPNIVYYLWWQLANTGAYATYSSGGSENISVTTGASAEYTFTGSQVTWIGYKASNRGIAEVYIDGQLAATVDCYSAAAQWKQPLFTRSFEGVGTHTIKIVVTGRKNPSATEALIDLDAFDITASTDLTPPSTTTGTPTFTTKYNGVTVAWVHTQEPDFGSYAVWRRPLGGPWQCVGTTTAKSLVDSSITQGETYEYRVTVSDVAGNVGAPSSAGKTTVPIRVENTDPAIVFSGLWQLLNSSGYATSASGGSVYMSTTQQNYAEYTFTGREVSWIGLKAPNRGIAQVYVDGQLKATIDAYSPGWQWQHKMYTATFLTSDVHTIRVVVTQTKNPLSTESLIDVDAFEVLR